MTEKDLKEKLKKAGIELNREFVIYENGENIDPPCTHFVNSQYEVMYVYSKPYLTNLSVEELISKIEKGEWTIKNCKGHYAYWLPSLRGRPTTIAWRVKNFFKRYLKFERE
jgi:hypothetical protein